ncbi:MAG: efflux RND transporter periplasmic adaptor subunit [Giesbergeria sp.]|jgi:RND family efflux transporter MFP subunit|nr:efflux RND transporter periplasmic adaptor subunit [Giesbergeria sp.]
MKRWIPWTAAAIVIVLVAGGAWRAITARQAQQQALAASVKAGPVVMEVAAGEISPVRRQRLVLGVPISGSLRALQSATIKARVAGELQGLQLREGDSVRAGQEVARIDPADASARLRQAQQQADAARAQVDINQRQFDNNRALVDQGFISRTALDTSQASLNAAQASYQAALAAADVARKTLADTVLRSPISGQVAQRLAQSGERVAVETRILEVVDVSRLELEALLAPADSVAVRVGQQARLTLEGHGDPLQATVVRISPSAQAGSRTVPVYLSVASPASGPALRQGLFVQGELDVGTADVLTVPLDAVRTDKPAPYLQVADNGRVVHRAVRTGQRAQVDGQTVVAIDGVPEGTLVLAGRVGALPEGTALRLPGTSPAPAASAATAQP